MELNLKKENQESIIAKKKNTKESTKKTQGYIEIKLNLLDFKEKMDKKNNENLYFNNCNEKNNLVEPGKKKINKKEIKKYLTDRNLSDNNDINNKSNLINTTNTTNNLNDLKTSYLKRENDLEENSNNNNNSNNVSLYEKLMKNNNIHKLNNNNVKVDLKSDEKKNKTSEKLIENILYTNHSDGSGNLIANNVNKFTHINNNDKHDPKYDISITNKIINEKINNNLHISSILSFKKKHSKTNKFDFETSKKLREKFKIQNNKNKEHFQNIPLWIENENKDLDFSVNTVCYDIKDNKLNSMPSNFNRDPYDIIDNDQKISNNFNHRYIDYKNEKCQTNNMYDKFINNVNKSQNINRKRKESEIIFDNENEKNNKEFLTNFENFNNRDTHSYDSLISNRSHNSDNSFENINENVDSGDNNNIYEGYDSAEETVLIRRGDSNNKKDERNEILIVNNF